MRLTFVDAAVVRDDSPKKSVKMVLFLAAAMLCAIAFGEFVNHFLKEDRDQRNLRELWESLLQPNVDSCINEVTKC